MSAYLDITGQRFGRLVALKDVGRYDSCVLWLCRCDCGKITTAASRSLRKGNTKSCGCLQKIKPNATIHGYGGQTTRTREYVCWITMRGRCNNPKNSRFKHYGGRGIQVCERWNSFENFFADMGSRPPGYSIERINNDGNYEPSNCKWIPHVEQAKNRSRFGSH